MIYLLQSANENNVSEQQLLKHLHGLLVTVKKIDDENIKNCMDILATIMLLSNEKRKVFERVVADLAKY